MTREVIETTVKSGEFWAGITVILAVIGIAGASLIGMGSIYILQKDGLNVRTDHPIPRTPTGITTGRD